MIKVVSTVFTLVEQKEVDGSKPLAGLQVKGKDKLPLSAVWTFS